MYVAPKTHIEAPPLLKTDPNLRSPENMAALSKKIESLHTDEFSKPEVSKYADAHWGKDKASTSKQAKVAFSNAFHLTRVKEGLSSICSVIKRAATSAFSGSKVSASVKTAQGTSTGSLTKEQLLDNILTGKGEQGFDKLSSKEKQAVLYELMSKHATNPDILNLLLGDSAIGKSLDKAAKHIQVEENIGFIKAYHKNQASGDFENVQLLKDLVLDPERPLNITSATLTQVKSSDEETSKAGIKKAGAELLKTLTFDIAPNILTSQTLVL